MKVGYECADVTIIFFTTLLNTISASFFEYDLSPFASLSMQFIAYHSEKLQLYDLSLS